MLLRDGATAGALPTDSGAWYAGAPMVRLLQLHLFHHQWSTSASRVCVVCDYYYIMAIMALKYLMRPFVTHRMR